MRLSKFILSNMEPILQQWEDFARTINESVHAMTSRELRDHAEAMLRTVALDLDTAQGEQASIAKSQGLAPELDADTAAEIHAADRLSSGFSIEQLTAEYRALRSSVIRLWVAHEKTAAVVDLDDIVRFDEAIDQALAESVARYSVMLRESQNLFLAILGHDVRTPLGAISMGGQMLLLNDSLSPQSVQIATRIVSSAKRASEIVSDLLDFSTSHLGDGIPVTTAPMDFAQVCETVVEEARAFHPACVITLEMQGDLYCSWDRARISQALANLVSNAIQHGAKDEPVAVLVNGNGAELVWSVHNAGAAIAPASLRTIFDPAKRFAMRPASERALSTQHNLGLGMYITREIICAHGGRISGRSSAADGTTFTVHLPRRQALDGKDGALELPQV
ncbi:HAMP domain-containing histidine kinase [Oxalobacteraceae bacterium]|nr:HAMP domain-containing histidine kinase [Oxalobacteraceae bacterium]